MTIKAARVDRMIGILILLDLLSLQWNSFLRYAQIKQAGITVFPTTTGAIWFLIAKEASRKAVHPLAMPIFSAYWSTVN
ncbi:MAG: hypothetical protein M1330_01735 [Armatimonadetes bacterium]|nr:hypothetical protein [Armatimonadota bacterium]